MPRVRRLVAVLVAAVVSILATTAPASAKAPPFTVELSDATPEAGERVTVTVRMWDPADRSRPSTLVDLAVFKDLLAIVPVHDLVDGRPPPEIGTQEPIVLRNVAPATFRGSFVAPEQGEHRIVPLPGVEHGLLLPEREIDEWLSQYPTTDLAVRSGTGEDGWPIPPIALGAVGAICIVAAMQWRRLLTNVPAGQEPRTVEMS